MADPVADAARRGGEVEDLTAWTAHGGDDGLSAAIRNVLAAPGAGELGDFVHGIPAGYEQDGAKATDADLAALGTAEAALAAADRDCKDTSALGSAVARAPVQHWAPLAGEHAGDLAAFRTVVEHARSVAADVNPR
ncbi:hypothetical protein [Kineococcus sp. SYSU DK006]|uniref:hypothetical protein n=1 Tax=Kineococcus sp. SYSU DK006 TaxID=3383127 RepID=UPI003D7D7522